MPPWKAAKARIADGPLFRLEGWTSIFCDESYPMAKEDWACVTNDLDVYLNPRREATAGEWEYVISHCLLHVGFDHIRRDREDDPLWNAACDCVVTAFLRDSRIGTPPPEFQRELPCPVRDEEQVYRWLREHPGEMEKGCFSTMTHGRSDMRWVRETRVDYPAILARSLQESMQDALRAAKGLPPKRRMYCRTDVVREARDWFVSSYPLLGALAASFRIVDDGDTVQRMGISIAAVSPQLGELYINPYCRFKKEEWRFILAHEFLHAALRHDVRCGGRNHVLWNVACDYVVNGWLVEMGVGIMPEQLLFDPQFRGMSVEAVYDVVCADLRRYLAQDPGDMLYGDESLRDGAEGICRDEFYRSALRQGLRYHEERGRGLLPAGLVEEIYAVDRPPIRWDVELAKWFDLHVQPLEPRRTYARYSRRQSATPDIPRPAWDRPEAPEAVRTFGVLLDTSGSMERRLLAAALGCIASYSNARDVRHVRVVFCDAHAYDQGVMSPDEIAGAVSVRGRGGTRLQPGIDLMEEDRDFPKDAPLLIITDGACDRLNLKGRKHAYLIPEGACLPFVPKGPVFRLK